MFLFVLFAIVACDVSRCLDNQDMVNLFGDYVTKYGRTYANDDETGKRYLIFCENVHKILDMKKQAENEAWNADWMGVTEFMDLSPDEFRKLYLSKPHTQEEMRQGKMTEYEFGKIKDIPENWDWNDHGAVTHVKNQGSCGSCWSFSATGNMEGQWFMAKKELVSFSEQQIVDCDTTSHGCQGGLMDLAFKYVINVAHGIETEDNYPYEGIDEKCKFDSSKINATFTSFEDLPKDEEKLKEWSYANGPIAVAMDAILLQFYFGGVFDPPGFLCPGSELDHGVLIVGWGTEKGLFGQKDFWIVKNSWGPTWGEKGFFKIKRGDSKCGINTCASTITV